MPYKCPCGTRPHFNVPGETSGICCQKCKTDEMIVVTVKRCPCGKQPVFNVPGKSIGMCCWRCKTSDMIDVVSKRCPCGKRPVYNIPGEKPICCKSCKTPDMIDISNKRCLCGKQPYFNVSGESVGVCCVKCKTPEMINVVSSTCPGYNGTECPVRTQLAFGRTYCMICDPNSERLKQYKQFEEAFFDYVKDKLNVHQRNFTVKYDQNETSKKHAFLDGIVMGDGVIVCLEVDEGGHRYYECDEHRMHLVTAELLQMYPNHVVSWVRVNPTVNAKNQWSEPSKNIRKKRFEDTVTVVKDILITRDTRVMYIGFDM